VPPAYGDTCPLFSTKNHSESRTPVERCQGETETNGWVSPVEEQGREGLNRQGAGSGHGSPMATSSRRPSDSRRNPSQLLGNPDLESRRGADHDRVTPEGRGLAQGREEEDAPLHVQVAVRGAAREDPGQGLHLSVERGCDEISVSSRAHARGSVGGETLVEYRHHDALGALVASRRAEGRGHRQPALSVDAVAISPFEHSGLELFHTFFHFSTPACLGPRPSTVTLNSRRTAPRRPSTIERCRSPS
jgi:hypothetical protein